MPPLPLRTRLAPTPIRERAQVGLQLRITDQMARRLRG
jgi:hypothetical protein